MDWMYYSENPDDETVGYHAIGDLLTLGDTGILKLKGDFINTAYSKYNYNSIVFGINLNTINNYFGKNYATVIGGNWNLELHDGSSFSNYYDKGTVMAYSLVGSMYCAVFGRIYTVSGDIGPYGIGIIPPGYLTTEIYLT